MTQVHRIKKDYLERVRTALKEKFNFSSIMQVPKLQKIVLNVGLGAALKEPKVLDAAVEELTLIAGQKPSVAKAKKSVSNFKLRQGMKIGAFVTLRGDNMYDFFDKLVTIVIPRVRDFQGLPANSFDGKGNYNFGVKEQTVFPEIKFDNIVRMNGMNITIVTSAKNDEEAKALLAELGFPFKKQKKVEDGKEVNDSQS